MWSASSTRKEMRFLLTPDSTSSHLIPRMPLLPLEISRLIMPQKYSNRYISSFESDLDGGGCVSVRRRKFLPAPQGVVHSRMAGIMHITSICLSPTLFLLCDDLREKIGMHSSNFHQLLHWNQLTFFQLASCFPSERHRFTKSRENCPFFCPILPLRKAWIQGLENCHSGRVKLEKSFHDEGAQCCRKLLGGCRWCFSWTSRLHLQFQDDRSRHQPTDQGTTQRISPPPHSCSMPAQYECNQLWTRYHTPFLRITPRSSWGWANSKLGTSEESCRTFFEGAHEVDRDQLLCQCSYQEQWTADLLLGERADLQNDRWRSTRLYSSRPTLGSSNLQFLFWKNRRVAIDWLRSACQHWPQQWAGHW